MRNWNTVLKSNTGNWPGLPAYLWGIETYNSILTFQSFILLPAYLWGIETPYPGSSRASTSVTSLPMRNWNRIPFYLFLAIRLLPAYLWGIETTMRSAPRCNRRSYQPTYEELKPLAWVSSMRTRCVTSLPMRNWNPIFSPAAFTSQNCYQPTYEELKQSSMAVLIGYGRSLQFAAYPLKSCLHKIFQLVSIF